MLDQIIIECQKLLNTFPGAAECAEYLNSRLNKNSQKQFEFGYFPSTQYYTVLTDVIDENILKNNKIFFYKNIEDNLYPRTIKFSFFDNYPLIMPYKDVYGNIVAIIGRTLLSETERKKLGIGKYKNTIFHKKNHLFGLYENKKDILEQDSVYVVEGQFDVIKAVESGLKNIVALGNSNMTSNQFSLINRYTNNIFLLLDNDEAGELGRAKIIKNFSQYANIKNLYLPKAYKDIDEYFSTNTLESLSFTIN
jgi:DNA primase catalytic core